ncbi:hydroxyacid dehydrogenase [Amycolatopsis acidiphila]|uniref:hydroxyacid dehydrogenase n=1 Tax=Amycolatopsis acidiphila TaxID=715473 RepID=UPI001643CE61|nr:hydroxyacid dehydrogenase [Amycolatopsis acidiphila]UIJ62521.1 hydroxyacid dehydrogenase [Amycolatopsis acidiphila]GHG85180.1 hypothetical protein GCM10017788_57650 [Amycolatopsis acidiphila]
MTAFRVLVPQAVDEAGIAALTDAGLDVVQPPNADIETVRRVVRDCDAVLLRTVVLDAAVLAGAPRLKVIARHGVGVDNIDLAYCAARGIVVTNAPESNTVAVAEHTLALLLAVAKNLRAADRAVRAGEFAARHHLGGIELAGRTLGVIGLGRIGRLVAQRAEAGLGMRVRGHDPAATGPDVVGLPELLAASDVVSLHVPLTTGTAGFFGAAEFAALKPGAYLVNCSRGGVVDETALRTALDRGQLAGAALDVFATEPLPAAHPLASDPRVLLTPHMAAHTGESLARMAVDAANEIIAVSRGEQPRWPVPLPGRS